jgi:hypothetical protein
MDEEKVVVSHLLAACFCRCGQMRREHQPPGFYWQKHRQGWRTKSSATPTCREDSVKSLIWSARSRLPAGEFALMVLSSAFARSVGK